jgi:hypothetical protein
LKHLVLVLCETLTPSITSDLLKSTIEQLKLEIGIPCQDGDWKLSTFSPCLTNGWLRDLLIFCEEEEISLVDTSPFPPLFSSTDSYLMQSFADVGYRDDDLATLNQCHLFLRGLSLSDLCTADGLSITYDTYNGRRHRCCDLGWPRSPPSLPPASWRIWRRALDKCCLLPLSSNRKL